MTRFVDGWLVALLLIVVIQVAGIGLLAWVFLTYPNTQSPTTTPDDVLMVLVVVTAAILVVLSVYVLLYHFITKLVNRFSPSQTDVWLNRWAYVILQDEPAPPAPLPAVAITTLVSMRELLKGEPGQQLLELAEAYGLKDRWIKQLKARSTEARVEALEALAVMNFPESLIPVLDLLDDSRLHELHPLIAMTAARSLTQYPAGRQQRKAIRQFADALIKADLSIGVLEETLALTEGAAAPLIIHLLKRGAIPFTILQAAISAVGWRRLTDVCPLLLTYIYYPMPRIRAAALRAFAQMNYLPPEATNAVINCLRDPEESVQIQAVRVLALLPVQQAQPLLWAALADPAWWVRQAAGLVLIRQGEPGVQLLQQAAQNHPDKLAAQLAAQFLLDRAELEKPHADEWIWARIR